MKLLKKLELPADVRQRTDILSTDALPAVADLGRERHLAAGRRHRRSDHASSPIAPPGGPGPRPGHRRRQTRRRSIGNRRQRLADRPHSRRTPEESARAAGGGTRQRASRNPARRSLPAVPPNCGLPSACMPRSSDMSRP